MLISQAIFVPFANCSTHSHAYLKKAHVPSPRKHTPSSAIAL